MYTGIVQGAFKVVAIDRQQGLHTLTLKLPDYLMTDLVMGASVAIDGVCLTVSGIDGSLVKFDVMQQTLELTTLGQLKKNDKVNVERSAKQGAEVGGHPVSGHIDGTVTIVSIEEPENNRFVSYSAPQNKINYIFNKGFIALNGCSLTVAEVDKQNCTFKVCFIPETLRVTTHGEKVPGDKVNFEIDRQTQVIVDTVKAFLADNPPLSLSSS